MDPVTLIVGLLVAAGLWLGWTQWGGRRRAPDAVRQQLAVLGEDYTVLSGLVRMRSDGVDAIDHVVVCPYGVFVILEERRSGRIQCRLNDLEWPVRGPGNPVALHNPVWRNRKRLNALAKELPDVPLIGLVVMVNARLTGDSDPLVIPFDRMMAKIRQFKQILLNRDQMGNIVDVLKSGK